MVKKELFDALDGFSPNLLVTLAEVEAVKKIWNKSSKKIQLRLENDKLRGVWKLKTIHKSQHHGRENLQQFTTEAAFIFAPIL